VKSQLLVGFLGASAGLFAAPSALAQGTPQNLIGGSFGAAVGVALQQQVFCKPGAVLCPLPIPPPPAPFAGGTAYDSFQQVIWETNGFLWMGVSAVSNPPCVVVCPPVAVPGLPANVFLTGLAFDDLTRTLIAIDSANFIRTYVVPPAGCPVPGFICPLGGVIPPNLQTGGLAYSEKHNLLYFSASNFAGGAPNTVIQVSRAPVNPCVPICPFGVPICPVAPQLGPITGMAFDDASDDLYITDGAVVMKLSMNIAVSPCAIRAVVCCAQPLPGAYHGLDIESSHMLPVGAPCTWVPCAACPQLALVANSDPSIGNATYGVTVTGAPVPSNAAVSLGFPGCTAGVPLWCGLFYPPLALNIVLPPFALAGAPPCAGTGIQPIPIPVNYNLCGFSFCAQAVVLCPGGGIGLTNALNGTLTDS